MKNCRRTCWTNLVTRCWCHGNLMNFRLFLVKGMHLVQCAVFLTGDVFYLSAPLWFMFPGAVHGSAGGACADGSCSTPATAPLFPVWPQWRPELAIALFGLHHGAAVPAEAAQHHSDLVQRLEGVCGGFWRVTVSLLLEVLFSVPAPVRMLFHTVFVVSAFPGWEVVWNSPQRDDDSTPWGEALCVTAQQLLLGLVWAVGMHG